MLSSVSFNERVAVGSKATGSQGHMKLLCLKVSSLVVQEGVLTSNLNPHLTSFLFTARIKATSSCRVQEVPEA